MSPSVPLFVYGTLRPPRPDTPPDDTRYYPQVAAYVQTSAPARLENAQLFDLGAFPGLRPGQTAVFGDLLWVDPAALEVTDRIEGHPAFFQRLLVSALAVRPDGQEEPTEAWAYFAPEMLVLGKTPLPGGDWLRRPRAAAPAPTAAPPASTDPALAAVLRRFSAAEAVWLATVRPDGQPHTVPIWLAWHNGRVYLVSARKSVKVRNLLANPHVVLHLPDPAAPVILSGWATLAEAQRAAIAPLFQKKYEWDILTDAGYDAVIEITPMRLMSWGPQEGRWEGEALWVSLD